MTAPPSNRWTVPVTRSPRWSSNSSKRLSRSASRIFWMITCLAVWAAIRPSSEGSILAPSLVASMAPVSRIDVDLDLGGVRVVLPGRGGERRLDAFEQDILGDILVAVDAIDDADQIDAHSISSEACSLTALDVSGDHSRPARLQVDPKSTPSRRRSAAGLGLPCRVASERATPPWAFDGPGRTAR